MTAVDDDVVDVPFRVTVVIPAKEVADHIVHVVEGVLAHARTVTEVVVVVDSPYDPTATALADYVLEDRRVRCLVQHYERGPAGAIRWGLDYAWTRDWDQPQCAVVMMGDCSDDPLVIDRLTGDVWNGAAVACASRFMPGGMMFGGPRLKRWLARAAGRSMAWRGSGTLDPTNAFKAYDLRFVMAAGIESKRGFALGIEMVAKARAMALPVTEVPTTWSCRAGGRSSFRLWRWLPGYLRWWVNGLL